MKTRHPQPDETYVETVRESPFHLEKEVYLVRLKNKAIPTNYTLQVVRKK